MAVIAQGDNIILRDRLVSDVNSFIFWQTHGEWRLLDAPWEGLKDSLTMDEEAEIHKRFLDSCTEELPSLRKTAIIADQGSRPLGWINSYPDSRSTETIMVGIDICEDDFLNKGVGTEALGLWIDYLFKKSSTHRIGLGTWSFNPRMIHVAEKLGFVPEGAQREVLEWEGQFLDLVHFGLLREEWKMKRMTDGK